MAAGTVARRPGKTRSSLGERFGETRTYEMLGVAWQTAGLGGKTVKLAVRPPFNWLGDAVEEANLNFRRCLIPLAISQAIWLTGFGILNFGEITALLGAVDRHPGGVYIGYVREVASWITMMILAGVAGSAVAADLGARKIRDELDALEVLGIDRIRKLVVPRVIAMTFCAVMLGLIGLLIAITVNYAIMPLFQEFTLAVYRESTYLSIYPLDLIGSFVKHTIMGVFIGLVACQKGLSSKGGAEGVGRAVNQTVIIAFVGIWAINSLYNVGFLTLFPELSVPRG